MKISFAITVSKEINEIKHLVPFLLEHKRPQDEIVVLFDEKNGDKEVLDFLLPFNIKPNVQTWRGFDFDYNFADWKNKLNSYCVGDYIFQLDADEMISEYMVKNVTEIISMNKDVELFFLPRINIVNGITQDHINRWGWIVDDLGRINFPDFQGRVYKKGLEWQGKVHERIIGTKSYSLLPSDEESYCIKHYKDISKQEKQNNLYGKIENNMSTTKKKCAVFTIVKNENYFLPIWLKHYKRYFDNSDIYVLDHQSNDGSTEGLDVSVELVINEMAFDHQWLVNTVENFQVKLLENYESVLFVEIDEILYSLDKPLNEVIDDFINNENLLVQSCISRDLLQILETEKSLDEGDLIIENRNYWFEDAIYHKTLLSKVPLKWVVGFHYITNHKTNHTLNLRMCHLHRFDFELMCERNIHRINNTQIEGGINGFQNKTTDRDKLMDFFIMEHNKKELIPEEHKIALKHI